MDNIGDYLYVILLILFSVIGAVSKKKKNVEQKKTKPVFEDVFEDLFPPVEEKPATATPKTEQQTINWPTVKKSEKESRPAKPAFDNAFDSYETATDYSRLKVKKQMKHTDSEFKKSAFTIEDEVENKVIEFDADSMEDVRRAIIFSEIINRKY